MAHHLGSPLNVIEGRAAMMASGQVAEADVKRNARIIAEQSSRMVQFLREIVDFAQRVPRRGTTVDLAALAKAAIAMFGPMARAHHASIALEGGSEVASVRGNPDTLLVALTHVLENGIRATPERGTLTVRLTQEARPEEADDPDGPSVPFHCLEVDDEGPGIEAQVLPRLFKPFTTTRGAHDAAGLGLFIAQSIAKEHGGWIEGVNKDAKGARFTFHLPQGPVHAE